MVGLVEEVGLETAPVEALPRLFRAPHALHRGLVRQRGTSRLVRRSRPGCPLHCLSVSSAAPRRSIPLHCHRRSNAPTRRAVPPAPSMPTVATPAAAVATQAAATHAAATHAAATRAAGTPTVVTEVAAGSPIRAEPEAHRLESSSLGRYGCASARARTVSSASFAPRPSTRTSCAPSHPYLPYVAPHFSHISHFILVF